MTCICFFLSLFALSEHTDELNISGNMGQHHAAVRRFVYRVYHHQSMCYWRGKTDAENRQIYQDSGILSKPG